MLALDARGGCLLKVEVSLRVCVEDNHKLYWEKKHKHLLRTECSDFSAIQNKLQFIAHPRRVDTLQNALRSQDGLLE